MPYKDPEARRQCQRESYQRHKAATIARQRARQTDPEHRADYLAYHRNYRLRTQYGITAAEWDCMFQAQNGVCAIAACTAQATETDHDHGSGMVRALLCRAHNTAMHADFTAADHFAMADYLLSYQGA